MQPKVFSQLCLDLDEASVEAKAGKQKQEKIRAQAKSELEKIYKVWNPEKLSDLNAMLDKYQGRKRELLTAVCKKYNLPHVQKLDQSHDANWSYVLKRFQNQKRDHSHDAKWSYVLKKFQKGSDTKEKWRNQEIERSLEMIRPALDEKAVNAR